MDIELTVNGGHVRHFTVTNKGKVNRNDGRLVTEGDHNYSWSADDGSGGNIVHDRALGIEALALAVLQAHQPHAAARRRRRSQS